MKKKIIITILAAVVLLALFFTMTYMNTNKVSLNETKFAKTEFSHEISFTLVESKKKDNLQSFILLIDNRSNNEIMYGEYYMLEMLIGDKWYEVYQPNEWYDLGHILNENCSSEVTILIGGLPSLKKGTYRIIKEISFIEDTGACEKTGYIAANFKIN